MSASTHPPSAAPSSQSTALVVQPDPFRAPSTIVTIDGGASVGQILDAYVPGWETLRLRVWVGDREIGPDEDLDAIYPRLGELVVVKTVPQGGRGGAGSFLLLAASIAGAFLAGPLAGALAGPLGIAKGSAAFGALRGGIGLFLSLGAALAASFIGGGEQVEPEDESYGIARFRNKTEPWGTPLYVRGKLRVYPKKAGQAIVENRGRFQILRELFDFGPGPLQLSDFRNGDRFLGNFEATDPSYPGQPEGDDFGGYDGFRVEWIPGDADDDNDSFRRRFYYGDTYTEEFGTELKQPALFDPGVEQEINPPLFVDGFDPDDPSTYDLAVGIINGVTGSEPNKAALPEDWKLANRFAKINTAGNYVNYQSFTVGGGTTRANEIVINLTFPGGIYRTNENGESDSESAIVGVIVQWGRKTLEDGSPDPNYQKVLLATFPDYTWTTQTDHYAFPDEEWVDHPALQEPFWFGDNWQAPLYHEIRINIQALAGYLNDGTPDVFNGPFVLTIWRVDDHEERETSACTVETIRIHDLTDAHRLEGHCLAQVFVRATGQLSGQMDEFNAWAESLCAHPQNNWSTATADLVASNDPFILSADALLRAPGCEDIETELIDLDAFAAAATANEKPDGSPWRPFNFAFDTRTSVREAIDDMLRLARARLVLPDGHYSVVVDDDKSAETIRQLVTPRTARDFGRGVRYIQAPPEALRVRFVNQEYSSVEDELVVPAPGQTLASAVRTEVLETKGIVDWRIAWLVAQEAHLETIHRREETTFTHWLDHMVYTVGDVIGVVHPTISREQQFARVVAVDETAGTLTLDTPVEMAAGTTYRVRWSYLTSSRVEVSDAYEIETDTGLMIGGSLVRPTTITVVDTVSTWPAVGDQIVVGAEPAPARYLVRSIEPRSDLSARVTVVPEAPEIHQALADLKAGNNPSRDELRVQDPHKWPEDVTDFVVVPKVWIIGWRFYNGDLNADPIVEHQDHPLKGQWFTLDELRNEIDTNYGGLYGNFINENILVDIRFEISFSPSPTSGRIRYSLFTLEEDPRSPLTPIAPAGSLWDGVPQPPPTGSWQFAAGPGGVSTGWADTSAFGGPEPDNGEVTQLARYRLWIERGAETSYELGQPINDQTLQAGWGGTTGLSPLERMPIGETVTVYVTARSDYGETPLEFAPTVVIDDSTHPDWPLLANIYATTVLVAPPEISDGSPVT